MALRFIILNSELEGVGEGGLKEGVRGLANFEVAVGAGGAVDAARHFYGHAALELAVEAGQDAAAVFDRWAQGGGIVAAMTWQVGTIGTEIECAHVDVAADGEEVVGGGGDVEAVHHAVEV